MSDPLNMRTFLLLCGGGYHKNYTKCFLVAVMVNAECQLDWIEGAVRGD